MGLHGQPRIGIVGSGFIGPAHVEALRRLGLEVRGLAESAPELAAEKAKGLRLARAYNSVEEMLSDPLSSFTAPSIAISKPGTSVCSRTSRPLPTAIRDWC